MGLATLGYQSEAIKGLNWMISNQLVALETIDAMNRTLCTRLFRLPLRLNPSGNTQKPLALPLLIFRCNFDIDAFSTHSHRLLKKK